MSKITPPTPSQSHDFKKGVKGSVVVLVVVDAVTDCSNNAPNPSRG